MGNLSENFSRSEFQCDDCGFDTVDVELLIICEAVREFVGKPVRVLSGCRCSTRNILVGGADKSQHLRGTAADLEVDNPKEVFEFLEKTYPGRFGFGLYDTHVHVDSRSNGPARWG